MEGDHRQNSVGDDAPGGRKHAVALGLGPKDGMEALQIESQTDQTPLASRRLRATQGELAEAQHLLDDADHRFDGVLACAIDRFAQGGRCRLYAILTWELASSGGGSGSGAKRCCQLG